MKRGSRSKYHPNGQKYHPGVKNLISEGRWDSVKVLAAYARSVGYEDPFGTWSDAFLASTLLELQDSGHLTLGGLTEDGEHVSITLHDSPEQAAEYRGDWKPGDAS
jgi:hypothetical protein